MTTRDDPIVVQDGVPAIAAAMWIGSAALMVLGIQPILLAGLVGEHQITDTLLGRLATAEVLAIAGGSVIGTALFRTGGMRMKAAALSALLALANIACCFAHGAASFFLLRFAAGALEGLLLGCTIVILTRTRSPDRANGVFLAAQTIPQALAALLLPIYLAPRWGSNASFMILAGLALAGVGLARFLPRPAAAKPDRAAPRGWVWTGEVVCVLVALTLQTAGIGAAMEYLAELATLHHFSPQTVGFATSGNLIFQVAGAFVVVGVAYRIPSAIALLTGVALQALLAMLFPLVPTGGSYVAVACLFGLFLLALGPFQVAWLVRIEPTRRVALLLTPITLVGWSLGPFVASYFVTPAQAEPAFWTAASLFVAAGAAYVSALVLARPLPMTHLPQEESL
jgi:predicted MFS family arabinose efflux permease